ncbi:hypothetical protein [Arthrobacter sp. STN4]|uniref:hypothetical protein n=1 Tax=Arthrobacter sp. STN4 TaxID=2923276 RepID=UPI00211A824E|nr:hypothetical protein [Arthrobacter sp. STN4]MCQ9163930.1 hypothetical protein [Arthrobacter sp. STN4]
MVDTKMTKSSGEHWVCTMLSRLNWGVALTRDGLERTDILAVKADDSSRMIAVQVKAASGATRRTSWPVGTKAQSPALNDREWFVFVALPEETSAIPRSFVVPRNHVSAAAWIAHMAWLTDPSAETGKRNAPIDRARVPIDVWERYENRWDLLERSAYETDVLLPPHFHALAQLDRVGLPPGHPWATTLPSWPIPPVDPAV